MENKVKEIFETQKPEFDGMRLHCEQFNIYDSFNLSENEVILFHGTPINCVKEIIRSGFNNNAFFADHIVQSLYYSFKGAYYKFIIDHYVLVCAVNIENCSTYQNSNDQKIKGERWKDYQHNENKDFCGRFEYQHQGIKNGYEYRIANPKRIRLLGILNMKLCFIDAYQQLIDLYKSQMIDIHQSEAFEKHVQLCYSNTNYDMTKEMNLKHMKERLILTKKVHESNGECHYCQ